MTAAITTTLAATWGWVHGGAGIGWWIPMMIGMMIFWGAIIVFMVWAMRRGFGPMRWCWPARQEPRQEPLEILRRRLADGSISVEEYEQRRATLETPGPHPA